MNMRVFNQSDVRGRAHSHDLFAISGGELKRGATDEEQNKVNGAAAAGAAAALSDHRSRRQPQRPADGLQKRGEKGSEVSPCSPRRGRT